MLQRQHSFLIREVKAISAAARQKFYFGVSLSLIRLKDKRKAAVRRQSALPVLRTGDVQRRMRREMPGRIRCLGNLRFCCMRSQTEGDDSKHY